MGKKEERQSTGRFLIGETALPKLFNRVVETGFSPMTYTSATESGCLFSEMRGCRGRRGHPCKQRQTWIDESLRHMTGGAILGQPKS